MFAGRIIALFPEQEIPGPESDPGGQVVLTVVFMQALRRVNPTMAKVLPAIMNKASIFIIGIGSSQFLKIV